MSDTWSVQCPQLACRWAIPTHCLLRLTLAAPTKPAATTISKLVYAHGCCSLLPANRARDQRPGMCALLPHQQPAPPVTAVPTHPLLCVHSASNLVRLPALLLSTMDAHRLLQSHMRDSTTISDMHISNRIGPCAANWHTLSRNTHRHNTPSATCTDAHLHPCRTTCARSEGRSQWRAV